MSPAAQEKARTDSTTATVRSYKDEFRVKNNMRADDFNLSSSVRMGPELLTFSCYNLFIRLSHNGMLIK